MCLLLLYVCVCVDPSGRPTIRLLGWLHFSSCSCSCSCEPCLLDHTERNGAGNYNSTASVFAAQHQVLHNRSEVIHGNMGICVWMDLLFKIVTIKHVWG